MVTEQVLYQLSSVDRPGPAGRPTLRHLCRLPKLSAQELHFPSCTWSTSSFTSDPLHFRIHILRLQRDIWLLFLNFWISDTHSLTASRCISLSVSLLNQSFILFFQLHFHILFCFIFMLPGPLVFISFALVFEGSLSSDHSNHLQTPPWSDPIDAFS